MKLIDGIVKLEFADAVEVDGGRKLRDFAPVPVGVANPAAVVSIVILVQWLRTRPDIRGTS